MEIEAMVTVDIVARYEMDTGPLELEAIFRNGDGDYVFRWIDPQGEIKVIEFCYPSKVNFYHDKQEVDSTPDKESEYPRR
jgi:hypothetical protein